MAGWAAVFEHELLFLEHELPILAMSCRLPVADVPYLPLFDVLFRDPTSVLF